MEKKHKRYAMHLAKTLGYLSPNEVIFLKKLARSIEKRSPVIVNIGAGAGTSGLALREARPDALLYTIDIRPSGPLGGLEGERNAFDKGGRRYPEQILGDSKEVGKSWDKKIDLLFVDGNHSKEGIIGDIEAWLPHVIQNGLVAFHDYKNTKWKDVKPVVDDKLSDCELLGIVNRIIVFRKPNE